MKTKTNTSPRLYNILTQSMLSIHKLYEVMNEAIPEWKPKLPQKIHLVLENMIISKATVDNINSVNQLIEKATKHVDDIVLANKSLEMTNIRLNEALDKAKNEMRSMMHEQSQYINQSRSEAHNAHEIESAFRQQISDLQKGKEEQFLSFSREIILLRDNLCMKEEMLKAEDGYQETIAWKMIQASYRETENILSRMGITVIHENGAFNGDIQTVTDTIPTNKQELHDTVAQTFREGYRTTGKLIRHQEVILYSYSV